MSRRGLSIAVLLATSLVATPALADDPAPRLELDLEWHPPDVPIPGSGEIAAMAPGALRIVCAGREARVELDGEAIGVCPQSRTGLTPGVHVVTFKIKGGKTVSRHVFVQAGSVHEVRLQPSVKADRADVVVRTVSQIVSTAIAIVAGTQSSSRVGFELEVPGLITGSDALRGGPTFRPGND